MFKRALPTVLFFIGIATAIAAPIIQSVSTLTRVTPTVIDGTSKKYPITVTMLPQSGVTATMEYSTTPGAYATPALANWEVLAGASAVSAVTNTTIVSPVTAIRFTRISGASSVVGEVVWEMAP